MTRVAWVADVHLGNHKVMGGPVEVGMNRRCREGLDVFRRAVALADELSCAAGVVLGDLFDYWRPEPQLLDAVRVVLKKARARWYLLVGNHDQVSGRRGDHALAPLRGVATVVDRPALVSVGGQVELALVPFVPERPAREWIAEALGALELSPYPRAVGVHAGVSDADTPPWLASSLDQIPAQELADLAKCAGTRAAFAGNWHSRRTWRLCANDPPPLRSRSSVDVVQVGALVPTGWDNPGLDGYGGIAVWEPGRPHAVTCDLNEDCSCGHTGDVSFADLVGPRFLAVNGLCEAERLFGPEAREQMRAEGLDEEVCWWRVRATAGAAERDAVVDLLRGAGLLGWEVLPDAAEVREEAQSAAAAARSAETLDEAVGAFVGSMPLPAGLTDADRLEVAALVRKYVAQGAARG